MVVLSAVDNRLELRNFVLIALEACLFSLLACQPSCQKAIIVFYGSERALADDILARDRISRT